MSEEKKLNGTVIVTYRCNARCSMCNRYKAPSKPEEEISIETIKKLPKMYFTNITGGEPFIRTDLKDIVRELYKKSDRIVISTNGFFTDRIVDLCKEFPQIGIRISIEGLEQTNNEIRGLQNGYQRGYGTLKKLREMGMKDVGFGMTVQDKNAPDLVPLYKISDEMGMEFATAYIVRKWKEGVISNTHLSDLLRLELLIRYGGLWIDSTTYMTGTIPAYIDDSNFFVYRNGWMDMEMINMGSWLIFSKYANNIILLETQGLLYAYWKKYNYIKNYFLMHIFFRMVTDANPELWEQVPAINHIDSHLLMQELPKHYDENRCQQIMRLTPIHKLTYKVETSSGATAEKLGVLFQNRREQNDSI